MFTSNVIGNEFSTFGQDFANFPFRILNWFFLDGECIPEFSFFSISAKKRQLKVLDYRILEKSSLKEKKKCSKDPLTSVLLNPDRTDLLKSRG